MKPEILLGICLPIVLTACKPIQLERAELVNAGGAVAMNENYALVGNQLLEFKDYYWVKGDKLPATSSGWAGEHVAINNDFAVIANSRNSDLSVFKNRNGEFTLLGEVAEYDLIDFGQAVHLVDNTLIVGAPKSATAIIYDISSGGLVEVQRITDTDEKSRFGNSIAHTGGYLFISDNKLGLVHVYKRTNGSYQEVQLISVPDGNVSQNTTEFGWSMDADSDWLAVAAYRYLEEPSQPNDYGRVFLYQLNKDTWKLEQKVSAIETDPTKYSDFGHMVDIHNGNLFVGDDGNRIISQFVYDEKWQPFEAITHPTGKDHDFGYRFAVNDQYLLASATESVLFGPSIPTRQISGRVVDPKGNPVNGTFVQGLLADVKTSDVDGSFAFDLPLGWKGKIWGSRLDINSMEKNLVVTEDAVLGDLVLQEIPVHRLLVTTNSRDLEFSYTINVSGQEPVEVIGPNEVLNIENYWSGTITPVKEGYRFTPESIRIEELKKTERLRFTVKKVDN